MSRTLDARRRERKGKREKKNRQTRTETVIGR